MSEASTLTVPERRTAREATARLRRRAWHIALLLLITCGAFAVLGYHPGVEDDGTYLATVKHDLNPALYPYDLRFVAAQMQLSQFDRLIVATVRTTHLPLAWAEILWQFAGLLVLLAACAEIAGRCFREPAARWGGVCFVGVMLALPVSATNLFLVDQHLHPRLLATDCILLAVIAILRGRGWAALPLLAVGALMHPLMTAFGVSFCCFLAAEQRWPAWWLGGPRGLRAAVLPASWLWEAPTPAWQKAVGTRQLLYLYKWPWYGWLGAVGPLALLVWLRQIGRRRGDLTLERVCSALLAYGVFQLLVAMVLLAPLAPPWFLQFEPMRFLHLVYLLGALLGAGAFARFWLRRKWARWVLVFVPLAAVMYAGQAREFAGSAHVEWPGQQPENQWLKTFAWIRQNTPVNAYFALNPMYTEMPGEGVHGFRALAERSALVDDMKDLGVVTHVPDLAARWVRESTAEQGWQRFGPEDFARLHRVFGVTWVVVARPEPALACPYHTGDLWVCRV